MLLHIEATQHEGTTVLTMLGDLDVASAPQLRSQVIEAISHGPVDLVLDLRNVDFIDSFGLGVIISALKRTALVDRKLQLLTDPGGPVSELLRITDLDRILEVRPGLETTGFETTGFETTEPAE